MILLKSTIKCGSEGPVFPVNIGGGVGDKGGNKKGNIN